MDDTCGLRQYFQTSYVNNCVCVCLMTVSYTDTLSLTLNTLPKQLNAMFVRKLLSSDKKLLVHAYIYTLSVSRLMFNWLEVNQRLVLFQDLLISP